MKLTHASVFSGIGGPEVAATMLGWENLFHCEINPFGKAVLDYWYPNAKSYDDITNTDFSEWEGRVNVLTGGFPCQPFSYAGQRRGATDDRYLWPYMFRCIDQIRPDWVVAENVAGILTMVEQGEVSKVADTTDLFGTPDPVQRFKLRETFTLQRICDDLESHGYSVQPVLIPACAVGAPHRRDRVFIVGCRTAPDTDNGTDGRNARQDESESREKWVQERNEVRQSDEPGEVRPESERNVVADTESNGGGGITGSESGQTSRQDCKFNAESVINGSISTRITSDTDGHRGCEMDEHVESQQPNGAEPVSNGRERDATDTESGRSGRLREQGTEEGARMRDVIFGNGSRLRCTPDDLGSRWANFPTVSPVHRGNDGIPFPLDSLTISAGKWRTEALKAYGNAIVPQVMYEIFRAIEMTYD